MTATSSTAKKATKKTVKKATQKTSAKKTTKSVPPKAVVVKPLPTNGKATPQPSPKLTPQPSPKPAEVQTESLEILVTVSGKKKPNLSAILINNDGSIRGLQFTDAKGKCTFAAVPVNRNYSIMVAETDSKIYQFFSLKNFSKATTQPVSCAIRGGGGQGSIIVTVLDNGIPHLSESAIVTVMTLQNIVMMVVNSDLNGAADLGGLIGDYKISASYKNTISSTQTISIGGPGPEVLPQDINFLPGSPQ